MFARMDVDGKESKLTDEHVAFIKLPEVHVYRNSKKIEKFGGSEKDVARMKEVPSYSSSLRPHALVA